MAHPHSKTVSLPLWTSGRQLRRAAFALGILVLAATALFIDFARREITAENLSRADIYANTLEQQANTQLGSADSGLRTLNDTLNELWLSEPPIGYSEHLSITLASVFRDRPFVRSLSLVTSSGQVIASSVPGNSGVTVNLSRLGPMPAPEGASALGILSRGHDLWDLAEPIPGNHALPLLPLLRTHVLPDGQVIHLVLLVNLDYFINQFELTLGNETDSYAALATYEGIVLMGTSKFTPQYGQSLKHIPVFQKNPPPLESGHYIGAGLNGTKAILAFRTLRQWPLVMLVEIPLHLITDRLRQIVFWVGIISALILTLLAGSTALVLRSLRRHESLLHDIEKVNRSAAASDARNNAVLESAFDGILTITPNNIIVAFNPAAEKIFGCKASKVIGQSMVDLMIPAHLRNAHTAGMKRYLQTGVGPVLNKRLEIGALHSDGHIFPMELTVAAVHSGGELFFTATVRDITEQKRIQVERAELLSKYRVLASDLETQTIALAESRDRELEIGNRIQQTLLVAPPARSNAGLWISSYNQASKGIDGDFFDIIHVGVNAIDVIAGDVMGKGVPAALMGAATKLQFSRSIAELLLGRNPQSGPPQPNDIVTSVNSAMAPHLQALDAFVTLVYLRIDLKDNTVTWVGCGHEESLLVKKNHGGSILLSNQHPPIGLFLDEKFEQSVCAFGKDDSIFLCSDGASDALWDSGERIGRDLVYATVAEHINTHRDPGMVLHTLRRDLLSDHVHITDDLTLVMLTRQSLRRDIHRIEIPVSLQSLSVVRGFVEDKAQKAALPEEIVGPLIVAAVEVVTNVIRHAAGLIPDAPIAMVIENRQDSLVIELMYVAERFDPPDEPPESDFGAFPEGGFGLYIIHNGCDYVDYLHIKGVNTVRMVVNKLLYAPKSHSKN